MRLGFHYHIPAHLQEGKVYTASYFGLFIDELAVHFEKVVVFLHSPRADELPQMDYALHASNVILVHLPEHLSIPRRLLIGRSIGRQVAQAAKAHRIDLLLLRSPTPLLPFIVKASKGICKHALLVVGDMRDHLDNLNQPWWRAPLVRQYIYWNEGKQEKLARNMLVMTNSAIFQERYARIAQKSVLVRTTTLRRADFFERKTLGDGNPFKLLYAGRIEVGKGLLLIAEAVAMLNQQGIDCQWDIVGWSEPGDETQAIIQSIFEKAGQRDNVVFHGKKKAGEALFTYYRNTDAYVMASLLSEGFPRTIWEAMANSAPVIATPVGSIPHYLKHGENALLVKPEAIDIAEKIRQLAESPELRKKFIVNGLKTAAESTLEFQSEKMAGEIMHYIQAP
jgi:glycosyltransferase involved in cell wall biosynthesis